VFKVISRANKYIDETAPWVLAKDESRKPRLARVLYNLLESLRICGTLLKPFMPGSMDKLAAQIGADESVMSWEAAGSTGALPAAAGVTKGENLFPRIDVAKELAALAELAAPKKDPIEPFKEAVPFDDFAKCDFRVCKVLKCENVKKSEKLLRFELDDGSGTTRQILSGIAKYYKPEELTGKTVAAIVNLPPRKMMGLESNGMLISAVHTEKGAEKLNLLILDDAIPAGSVLC
jgi:methionyl-tRNA synthetase